MSDSILLTMGTAFVIEAFVVASIGFVIYGLIYLISREASEDACTRAGGHDGNR